MATLTRRISEEVTRYPLQRGGEDAQGNPIVTHGPGETIGIYVFDPGSSTEPRISGRDAVVTEPKLFLPYGSPFGAGDQCEVRGARYNVEGEPLQWRHPRDGPKCDVVSLRRVDG